MPEFEGPMSAADWSTIPASKKRQMIPAFHQSIIHQCSDRVMSALVVSINHLIENNRDPNQALAIVAQVNDPALPFANMDAEIRKKIEQKIGDFAYIVIPNDREGWTGGPGAPHWGEKHPYRPVMLELCKDPDPGKLWVVIFAGGGATAFQLSAQTEESASMGNIVMADGAQMPGQVQVNVEFADAPAPIDVSAEAAPAEAAAGFDHAGLTGPTDPFEK